MRFQKKAKLVLVLGCMLAIILDGGTSVAGCYQGIELCIKNVIPALFPFLVLSPILSSAMCFNLPHWLHTFLKLPEGSDSLWISGCLGGYPVGAQCIAQAAQSGQISKNDARRLISFCCNCGPGFIFGICSAFFEAKWAPWGLWLCHIAGSMIIGWLIPGKQEQARLSPASNITLTEAFNKGIRSTAQVCGWVILFRCLLEFAQHWGLGELNIPLRVLLAGMLELTNGCFLLPLIQNEALRFVICEALLSFGGLCVAMQTASVGRKIPLDLYLPGKLGQSLVSAILATIIWAAIHRRLYFSFFIGALFLTTLTSAKAISKKYSRNLSTVGV